MQGEKVLDFVKYDHTDFQTENTDSILGTVMEYSEIQAIPYLILRKSIRKKNGQMRIGDKYNKKDVLGGYGICLVKI